MAIWDFRPKTDVVTGVALGVGVIAAPVVVPLVWSVVRPALKAVLKSGFMLYETGRGVLGASAEVTTEKPQEAAKAKGPRKPQGRKKATTGKKKVAVKVLTPEAATSLRRQAKSAAEKEKEEKTREATRDES